ncbi:hypothetical protein [Alteraurantiacibacter buctensis]|uniref:Uncharacterized protein n=1 Tax=Alteraurantiacibacter buctensis TaxID=1503981 RepID=A0A844YWF6_9SPHN|nr:hypothetical protein [Alteraurantiacibacter buctensis]MXO71288.1 hypothetical protein [Alteraurantiacibacter buctensis]
MLKRRLLAVTALAAAATVALVPALSQNNSQTVARYTMDAGTLSGMAAMTAGGGGGLGGIMNMMRGGDQVAHELVLRLGSSRSPTGNPAADHFMPQGAGLGASVPLVTPTPSPRGTPEPGTPGQQEMPRGRLLLFWGCGEHAPAGQPVIIDFSRLARGEVPAGLYASGLDLPDDWEVLVSNSTTYGDWPNARESRSLTSSSSLLGAHRVAGNYSPEISFTLAEDFMPALNPSGAAMPSGAVRLTWANLTKATGYYAWAVGAGANGNDRDMVWWASSRTQAFGGPMASWISPSAAAQYVRAGTLMAPGTTECVIPAEVKQAGGEALMTSLYAYGPQQDFSYPERPRNAPASWRPEWIARVRFRSMAMVIPGMDMGLGSGRGEQAESAPEQPPAKPRCRGGLRGMAERAAGLCE